MEENVAVLYQNGVLRPLSPLKLRENQTVYIRILETEPNIDGTELAIQRLIAKGILTPPPGHSDIAPPTEAERKALADKLGNVPANPFLKSSLRTAGHYECILFGQQCFDQTLYHRNWLALDSSIGRARNWKSIDFGPHHLGRSIERVCSPPTRRRTLPSRTATGHPAISFRFESAISNHRIEHQHNRNGRYIDCAPPTTSL